MFYVADINGDLHAYIATQPTVTPTGAAVDVATLLDSALPLDPVSATDSAEAQAANFANASEQSEPQDAAVFEGHALQQGVVSLDDIEAHSGAAASAMAYRAVSSLKLDPVQNEQSGTEPVESVTPAAQSGTATAYAGRHGEVPAHQRVQPVDQYRHERQAEERMPALTADQIMTSPVFTLSEDAAVAEALHIFRTKRFRHIPVTSRDGRLIGILSDRDFLPQHHGIDEEHPLDPTQPIRKFMTSNILTARPQADIRSVAQIMLDQSVRSIPIVDERGELQGMITTSDILRSIVNHAPLQLWT